MSAAAGKEGKAGTIIVMGFTLKGEDGYLS